MKMKKGLLTMLALLSMGSSVFAQGTVNVPTVVRKAGEVKEVSVVASRQGKVKIELQGGTTYRDLQFDLTLPAGVTVTTDGGVVQDAAASHTVAFNAVSDQVVRFVVYNDGQDNNVAEKFTDGIIVEIPVTVADTYTGSNPGSLSTVFTSNDAAESIAIADAEFSVRACLLGDVDDDEEVALNDAIYIARFVVEGNPQPFVEEVADFDGKDGIALNDAIEVARFVVTDVDTSSSKQLLDVEDSMFNEMDPE